MLLLQLPCLLLTHPGDAMSRWEAAAALDPSAEPSADQPRPEAAAPAPSGCVLLPQKQACRHLCPRCPQRVKQHCDGHVQLMPLPIPPPPAGWHAAGW